MSDVDFGKTVLDFSRHRAGFPEELMARLAPMGIGLAGQEILDLGTGTGSLARRFAAVGCRATALDVSSALLKEARRLSLEEGLAIEFVHARAEETGLADAAFDVVAAGQCWHWFDRPRAAAEARRLLRPGGALLVAHFDWIPLPGNLAHETEHLIERHNPHWGWRGSTGLHPAWLRDAAVAGFESLETFSFDVWTPYDHDGWRGRVRASAGVAASLPPEGVARFDEDLAELLRTRFPAEPIAVQHRVFALVARAPRTHPEDR